MKYRELLENLHSVDSHTIELEKYVNEMVRRSISTWGHTSNSEFRELADKTAMEAATGWLNNHRAD